MLFLRCAIALLLGVSVLSKQLNPRKVVYAVDCGNEKNFKGNDGISYLSDRGYSPNTKVADYSLNAEAAAASIRYTHDPSIYMTERHADETFYYDIPVTAPGTYVLISKFSENWLRAPKTRVFNIMFGDCIGEANIDLFGLVGKYAAYDSYVEFELRNGNIYVKGEQCRGAYFNGKLRAQYTKIGYDNPMVDAIVLFQGTLDESDYADQANMRKDWERTIKEEAKRKEEERLRKEEARLKRREKTKIRNDDYEDFGDEFEDVGFNVRVSKSLGDYIMDYLGLIFILAVGGGVIYLLAGKGAVSSVEDVPSPTVPTRETREKKKDKEKEKDQSGKKAKKA